MWFLLNVFYFLILSLFVGKSLALKGGLGQHWIFVKAVMTTHFYCFELYRLSFLMKNTYNIDLIWPLRRALSESLYNWRKQQFTSESKTIISLVHIANEMHSFSNYNKMNKHICVSRKCINASHRQCENM